METPLLLTKFNLPSTGAGLTHRPRLWKVLDQGLDPKMSLILVCGPAGYGKTTLVSEWLQAAQQIPPGQYAWLTLERGDDDLARFLGYFITALQRIQPGFGQGVLGILRTHKPSPVPVLATLLINELSELPGRVFLVLDDYHLLSAESIHAFMNFLVDHQPKQLCLVILSRSDPSLPLARLRGRGQLVEVRQEALCFLKEEVNEFANQSMGLALSPTQVDFLTERTEGWISGLQLAAISIRETGDRRAFFEAFSGADRFIADYLTEEVLSRLPATLRTFLLETSLLERLSAPLCEAVTGQPGAQASLHQLVEANLFIVPLDNQQSWFRYHVLFSDLLRKRLQEEPGEQVDELHLRASCWFEANGLVDLAIEHALSGKEEERAGRLIEEISERLLMTGQMSTLVRWLDSLPASVLHARPFLGIIKGLSLILCNRPLETVLALRQELASSGSLDHFQAEAATLESLLAILQGRTMDAIRLSEEAVRTLPPQRVFLRSLAADGLGMAYTMAGDFQRAMPAFEQVVEIATESDNIMMSLMALTNLAGLRLTQGHLRQAIQNCQDVIELASQRIGRHTPMLGKTLLNLGGMLREQGDFEAAERYLLEAAEKMEFFSEIGLPMVWLELVRIKISQKDWQAALAYLERARGLAVSSRSTQMDDRMVDLMQARYQLARGDLAEGMQWAHRLGLLDRSPQEFFSAAAHNAAINEILQAQYLTVVRLLLAQNQAGQALEMLNFLQPMAEQRRNQRRINEILVLKSLALHQKGDLDQALESLGKVLSLAELEGYQRIFLDEGEPMDRLLYQAVSHGICPAYAGNLLALTARESSKPATGSRGEELIEPLSPRELEVLELIANGLSNAEIAARLFISLSTVKGHTTNIFGKLGVKNRSQAVARARGLGLFPPG